MESKLKSLQQEILEKIELVDDPEALESLWVSVFATSGSFTALTKEIKNVPTSEKPVIGQLINMVKKQLEDAFDKKKKAIILSHISSWQDVTIPGEKPPLGHLHPQTQVLYDLLDVFKSLGFQAADGPEIETDWYNFGSLNFPPDHPARDTQQSLHLDTKNTTRPGEILLRTQTSAMQVRVMETTPLPIRVIVPGKAFRYEQVDASHGFEFWQLEGFAVDRNITLSNLFGTITTVLKKIMGDKTKLRFACTNFPFVEPGVDTYMQCTVCEGKGCSFCKNSGWSEIMPAGMIHPNVLKSAKIDPKIWQGFAFAIGLSRAVTLRYGMDDLRLLTTPDLRILNQF